MRLGVFALIATASAATAGCADQKVQRSSTPVNVDSSAGAGATTPAASGPTSGATSASVSGSFTGVDVPNRYGDVQVEITVKRGHITDVGWLKLPMDRARSRDISAQAAPILRSEVLAAQSAQIDLVSGATYTSDSWARSVQSALSQVR